MFVVAPNLSAKECMYMYIYSGVESIHLHFLSLIFYVWIFTETFQFCQKRAEGWGSLRRDEFGGAKGVCW